MTKWTITIATAGLLCAVPLRAQHMTGYSPAAAERERRVEQSVVQRPSPATASAHSRALTREPHMAGTAAQARTRDYVLGQMRRWGLATEVREYRVYLPHTREVAVWRVAPDTLRLSLAEGPVPGDTTIDAASEPVIANGWSGSGDASGPVVYVNYGLIEDYRLLDSLGVSVRGAIVLARYGRSFRGIKAREAERHGAAALLLYSDPADDGYTRGDVYPEGPMRPPSGLQRGAVANTQGDPTTPGYASRPGVPRADPAQDPNIPRIPVVPISYANAAELLRGVRGQHIPQAWQGGLPFRYHIGPGPVLARVLVRSDTGAAAFKQIWNTLGIVRGSERPDEVVVVGAHRDAWAYGAVDNVSGTVSVLEAARAVAEEVRAGRRPRRTIIFATWDAEEWGLVGSTEYVEDDSLFLMRGGVAYLNQDAAASGARFGAGGSPSLRSLLRDVLRSVPDPAGGSVYERWRRSSSVPEGSEPEMDDPGGGSDFAGFYNHLGIPHLDWGFGGPSGIYHSFYDSYSWMSTFGDTGFVYHATAGRIAAATALRLANAEVLPYDYAEFARTLRGQLQKLAPTLDGAGDASSLGAALDRMERSATALAAARDSALSSGRSSAATRDRANAALLRVERALTRPEGLRGRPWYRSLIFAADENNGYATVLFPSVTEAARRKDAALVTRELADLASRFDAASAALAEATAALRAAR